MKSVTLSAIPKSFNTRRWLLSCLIIAACNGGSVIAAPIAVKQHAPAAQSFTLRRLTETQYRQSIADIFGADIKVLGSFEPDMRVHGLLAEGTTRVAVTPNGLEQYENVARGIAAQVTDAAHWQTSVGCMPGPGDANGARCAAEYFTRIGRELYRRPLLNEEIKTAVNNTLTSAKKLGNFQSGIEAALAGMLTSPDFLFRIERAVVDANNANGSTLDSWSKATRLSFFLWNTTPDAELLAAAERGDLNSDAGLAHQVERMMASPRFNDGVRAFFDDFLRLDGLNTLSKDAAIYPSFSAAVAGAAREQTLRTISALLVDQRGSYLDLFTTRRFAMNRTLSPLYNVPVAAKEWSFYEFPESDARGGLLTQISFLALYSHPGRSSPTLRGKAVREILMCEEVPAPPANVNFSVVQDVTNANLRTTRERVQAHLNDEDCAGCHKKTDPIGLGLEKFDGTGLFRALENNAAIDVSGAVDKATFNGATELGATLKNSPATTACIVQSTYRYAVGRGITTSEQAAIDRYQQMFAGNGYRFVDLVRTIAITPAFYTAPSTKANATLKADAITKRDSVSNRKEKS
jgi:uncharacterized protein DUF1592/uncharacterized protein DUF1588/uncharacterized protein DUF1595/uncharacterized protein DUF1585/uncharacterized protein DUF1587